MNSSRQPNPAFVGRNGFTENIEPPTPLAKDLRALHDYRVAQKILSLGPYWPSKQELLNDMKRSEERESLKSLEDRIEKLQKQHLDDLNHLYDMQAQEYLQEQRDRYLSKDDSQVLTKGENNPVAKDSYAKLDTLYRETSKSHVFSSEWDDTIDSFRYAHLKHILPLYKRRKELEVKAKEAKRIHEARFPSSPEEYRSTQYKDIQIRVARFLMADKAEQEKMMSRYGWAHRQVQPLRDDYHINRTFRAEIVSKLVEVDASDRRTS